MPVRDRTTVKTPKSTARRGESNGVPTVPVICAILTYTSLLATTRGKRAGGGAVVCDGVIVEPILRPCGALYFSRPFVAVLRVVVLVDECCDESAMSLSVRWDVGSVLADHIEIGFYWPFARILGLLYISKTTLCTQTNKGYHWVYVLDFTNHGLGVIVCCVLFTPALDVF